MSQFSAPHSLTGRHGVALSIITATLPSDDRVDFLVDAFSSLTAQIGRPWSWEWLVQVDGDDDSVERIRDALGANGSDPRVKLVGNGRTLGAAITRNLALARASGAVCCAVDDDDQLAPTAMEAWLGRLERNPQAGYVVGMSYDFDADHDPSPFWPLVPEGIVPCGGIKDAWDSPQGIFPVHPLAMAVRTKVLRSVGGWQGLPQGEDFGMTLAVSGHSQGMCTHEPVYCYRAHPAQTVRTQAFQRHEATVREIVWHRALAIAACSPGAEQR